MSYTFYLRDFLLDIDDPKKLVKSRWPRFASQYYITYRVVLAAITSITLIYIIVNTPKYGLIFLSTWGYAVMTLNFLLKVAVVIKYSHWLPSTSNNDTAEENLPIVPPVPLHDVQRSAEPTPYILQFSWLLSNIATTSGIAISVIKWTILSVVDPSPITFGNISIHVFNSVFLITDLLINSEPRRMAHFYQPATLALAYLAFSAIYWAAGGMSPSGTKAIYPFLEWNDGVVTSVGILVGYVIAVIAHVVTIGITMLRDCGLENEPDISNYQTETEA